MQTMTTYWHHLLWLCVLLAAGCAPGTTIHNRSYGSFTTAKWHRAKVGVFPCLITGQVSFDRSKADKLLAKALEKRYPETAPARPDLNDPDQFFALASDKGAQSLWAALKTSEKPFKNTFQDQLTRLARKTGMRYVLLLQLVKDKVSERPSDEGPRKYYYAEIVLLVLAADSSDYVFRTTAELGTEERLLPRASLRSCYRRLFQEALRSLP